MTDDGDGPPPVHGRLRIPYRWAHGPGLDAFFAGTRDDRQLLGSRCPRCEAVLVPPQSFCGRCFCDTDAAPVRVGPTATLISWTEVHLPFPGQPTQPPYIFALIQPTGADTLFTHLIGESSEDRLEVGLEVEAVWAQERTGDLRDIRWFRPTDSERRIEVPAAAAPAVDAEPWTLPRPLEELTPVERIIYAFPLRFVPTPGVTLVVQFCFKGAGGGDYWVAVDGVHCAAGPGLHDAPTATLRTKVATWLGVTRGEVNPQMAFLTGRIRVKGRLADVQRLNDRTLFERRDPFA